MNKKSSCSNCSFFPFCALDDAVVKQQVTLKKKQVLYFPKTPFKSLYVIQSGSLKTFETDGDGHELIRGFYFSGEILGLEAIAYGTYLFSAMALTKTLICEVPYNHFIELLNANSTLQKQILYLTSKQLTVNFYLNYITAEQRLACFLMDLFKRLHVCNQHKTFLLPMSRQDIGNYLRLSGETVSPLLTRFKKHNIIACEHKTIQIIALDKLQFIANQVN